MATELSREVVDDRAPEVPAGLEVVEDVVEIRERADAGDVALDPTRFRQRDELTHVLHGARRRVDDGRVLQEELERIELEVAFARGRETHGDEQTVRAEQVETEPEPRHPGREHQA